MQKEKERIRRTKGFPLCLSISFCDILLFIDCLSEKEIVAINNVRFIKLKITVFLIFFFRKKKGKEFIKKHTFF